MKYVTLSFDDGLLDFYSNAFPLLHFYHMLCTLNVITGFVTRAVHTEWDYIDETTLRVISAAGHEVALHSHSHLAHETPDDFQEGVRIMRAWKDKGIIADWPMGVVMPYNQLPSSDLAAYFASTGVKYVGLGLYAPAGRGLAYEWRRLIGHISKKFETRFLAKSIRFFNRVYGKSHLSAPIYLNRIEIKRDTPPSYYLHLLDKVPAQTNVTFMFHSILQKPTDPCPYPEGAWLCSQFEMFLAGLASEKDVSVVTQSDALRFMAQKDLGGNK